MALSKLFLDLMSEMLPTNVPAANKWRSISRVLAALSILILVAGAGATAWLQVWPLDIISRQEAEAEHLPDDDHVKVSTKRLKRVSELMQDSGPKQHIKEFRIKDFLHAGTYKNTYVIFYFYFRNHSA